MKEMGRFTLCVGGEKRNIDEVVDSFIVKMLTTMNTFMNLE